MIYSQSDEHEDYGSNLAHSQTITLRAQCPQSGVRGLAAFAVRSRDRNVHMGS